MRVADLFETTECDWKDEFKVECDTFCVTGLSSVLPIMSNLPCQQNLSVSFPGLFFFMGEEKIGPGIHCSQK